MKPVDRRTFLGAGAAGAGALLVGDRLGLRGRSDASAALSAAAATSTVTAGRGYHGANQAGILEAPTRSAVFAAFDVITEDRRELTDLFRELTAGHGSSSTGECPPATGRPHLRRTTGCWVRRWRAASSR